METDRKMQLIAVRTTFDGEPHLGCRAIGMHRGHYIECTVWIPVENIPIMGNEMERIATGKYRHEVECINRRLGENQ